MQRRLDETPRDPLATKEDVTRLQESRDKLRKQRNILDSRLAEGALLSPQEERRWGYTLIMLNTYKNIVLL